MRTSLKTKLTKGILDALATRATSARAVAALYGVSEAHLSRTLADLGLQKIPAPTMEQKRKSHLLKINRTTTRTMLAKQVVDSHKSIYVAAREANCSVRTMYRYIELCKEPKND